MSNTNVMISSKLFPGGLIVYKYHISEGYQYFLGVFFAIGFFFLFSPKLVFDHILLSVEGCIHEPSN